MTNFNDFLNEQMKDPEFKAEWDALDPEFSVIEAMLKARKESGLTQKQLSERTGIAQTDISKLERGNANPSLRTLQRLAAGMGMKVAPDSKVCLDGKLFCTVTPDPAGYPTTEPAPAARHRSSSPDTFC